MLLRRKELVCQEVVEWVTAYLDGALSKKDRRRFEAHLSQCPHCSEYLHQMKATIRLTGELHPEDLSEGATADFTRIFREWKQRE